MRFEKHIKRTIDAVSNKIKILEENLPDSNRHILKIDKSLQLDSYSCGVQSTFAILKYYGKARSVYNVEKLLGADKSGTPETSIYKLLRQRGLKVSLRRTATFSTIKESITDYKAPFLTSIDTDDDPEKDKSHYIVVHGYSDNYIYVLDPAIKRPFVRWKKKKFRDRWDKNGAIIYK
jgi:ABC-type bacteriocin/lantibiotic exporter with double-glycine peptidase domain